MPRRRRKHKLTTARAPRRDEQLRRLVMINGAQKWSVVAEKIKVRPSARFMPWRCPNAAALAGRAADASNCARTNPCRAGVASLAVLGALQLRCCRCGYLARAAAKMRQVVPAPAAQRRWWNHLNPEVKKGAFSDWEDAVIIKVRAAQCMSSADRGS
jgi:hypothetical protein